MGWRLQPWAFFFSLCPVTLFYLWVMNRSCFIMKWGKAVFWEVALLYLVVCFRPWRAHLNLALLFPVAPPQCSWVVLVAMEDTRKWCGAANRIWVHSVCMCTCMFCEGVCVKCFLYVLIHLCTKIFALCMCVLRQPAEQGKTSAHSGTGLLPLHMAPAEQRFTA